MNREEALVTAQILIWRVSHELVKRPEDISGKYHSDTEFVPKLCDILHHLCKQEEGMWKAFMAHLELEKLKEYEYLEIMLLAITQTILLLQKFEF